MARSQDDSQNKGRGKKALGVIGVSVSLAGAVCAPTSSADAATPPATDKVRPVDLHEEEVFDVGMSTFRLFDREDVQDAKPEVVAQWGWGCRGCRGCRGCGGCRGCRGCGGCRGCRGCGG